jgi:PAS domain S-box-containing protein
MASRVEREAARGAREQALTSLRLSAALALGSAAVAWSTLQRTGKVRGGDLPFAEAFLFPGQERRGACQNVFFGRTANIPLFRDGALPESLLTGFVVFPTDTILAIAVGPGPEGNLFIGVPLEACLPPGSSYRIVRGPDSEEGTETDGGRAARGGSGSPGGDGREADAFRDAIPLPALTEEEPIWIRPAGIEAATVQWPVGPLVAIWILVGLVGALLLRSPGRASQEPGSRDLYVREGRQGRRTTAQAGESPGNDGEVAPSRDRALFEALAGATTDGVLLVGLDGRIRSWNEAATKILGFRPDEMIGEPYERIVPPGAVDAQALRDPALREGQTRGLETERLDARGRRVRVRLTRSLVRGNDGSPLFVLEILRDASRDQRIHQELLTAEKLAAVGKMSSKVVHEIRNPLASFNLNVDLLCDFLKHLPEGERAEAEEIVETLKRETRRLRQITEEYLQFSRLPRLQFREADINQVLLDLADFVRPEFRRKGVRILLRLDEQHPKAICDPGLVRQACLNLVRNAMEAAGPQGHIRLSTADLGEDVEIRVADDGCGIPEENLPRIFEPFFTTKRDGTGLGLAVVRQIVEEHGGDIRVRSLVGRGTTFLIRLPKRPPQVPASE